MIARACALISNSEQTTNLSLILDPAKVQGADTGTDQEMQPIPQEYLDFLVNNLLKVNDGSW